MGGWASWADRAALSSKTPAGPGCGPLKNLSDVAAMWHSLRRLLCGMDHVGVGAALLLWARSQRIVRADTERSRPHVLQPRSRPARPLLSVPLERSSAEEEHVCSTIGAWRTDAK
jgi:hypothetical protein